MSLIALVNHSRLASSEVSVMARVVSSQLYYHASPAWTLSPRWTLSYYPDPSRVPPGAFRVALFDDADQAGALGYHSVGPDGMPYGRVFVDDAQAAGVPTSSVLSHEAVEILGDPYANEWVDMPDGRETAKELCDAVEANLYTLRLTSGISATVSDFLLPAWFEDRSAGPWDHLGRAEGPFRMTPGGYMVVRTPGAETEILGSTPDARGKRHPASRTRRRLWRSPHDIHDLVVPEEPAP